FARQFEEKMGSIKCWKILGLPEGPSEPLPEMHTPEYLAKRPCLRCIEAAAQIVDEYLAKQREKGV
ncbi:MAG: C_GCAxxG_C_C family protein, partial [Oscillospiraceae bacterium]|nr:C_GCAxxG_C_C family protein [Oscillospiraceae bacterium]